MLLKRYEYWTKDGKTWSNWFPTISKDKPEWQLYERRISSRLKNEYKEI